MASKSYTVDYDHLPSHIPDCIVITDCNSEQDADLAARIYLNFNVKIYGINEEIIEDKNYQRRPALRY